MNMRMEISRFDQKLHQWEHKAIYASEKLVHQDKFRLIAGVLLAVLIFIAIAVFSRHGDSTISPYLGPFGPFYPYGR